GGDDGDARRTESGGCPGERHEVAARRTCDGDHTRQLLDVIGCSTVVPDDPAFPGARDRPSGVAPIRAENRVTALPDELLVGPDCDPCTALVVQGGEVSPGVTGPK